MFSIIVPAHGDLDLLTATLRSAAQESTADCEILVVGDTDSAAARLPPEIPGNRFVWVSVPGMRPAAAINEGLRRARGEFLSILAPGDTYFDKTLRIVAETARRHPRAGCIVGDVMLTDASGRPIAEFNGVERSGRRSRQRCRFCGAAVFFRAEAVTRLGGLDKRLDRWPALHGVALLVWQHRGRGRCRCGRPDHTRLQRHAPSGSCRVAPLARRQIARAGPAARGRRQAREAAFPELSPQGVYGQAA